MVKPHAFALLVMPALWAGGFSLPVPSTGAYLGIWANPALGANPEAAIEAREGPAPNGINHGFALHLHYYGWTKIAALLNNGVFEPDLALQGDIAHGRVPVISWVCDGTVPSSDHVIGSGDAGEDAVITSTARALAQYPGPVLLRWFWEFNVLVNNQSCRGDAGGKPTQQVYTDFIAAWRHIRQLFQNAGAANVVFLWNPGHYPSDGAADDPHGFYPGNDYVDWIGLDTYQDDVSTTFAANIEPFYSDFSQSQYGGKPLMVGENGTQNWSQHNQEVQAAYLRGILADLQNNLFPRLKAYCYFDSTGARGDWTLDDDNGQGSGGLAAMAALAASAGFSPPGITVAANAEGDSPVIAPNTWVEVKGLNLASNRRAWTAADFVNNQMPTELDGVSATVNGKSAYVYYVSPTQINILTPPEAIQPSAQVVVTHNGASSGGFAAPAQALSPSLFVFNGGPYVAAVHANGTYIGPTALYPGLTTPAAPGETILLYANGFGPTSVPVAPGSVMQGGTLSPLPVVQIGGITAAVQFAGLTVPGEFQFNVVVPADVPAGDQPIVAAYDGTTTQSGTLITIAGAAAR